MKLIFKLITDNYPISGIPEVDQILYIIIGAIAFATAFGLVGMIFDFFGKYDSQLMSDTHWFIRLIVFVGLSWLLKKFFQFISWISSFPIWVYVIICILLVGLIFLFHFLKHKRRKIITSEPTSKNPTPPVSATITLEKPIPSTNVETVHKQKDMCPRCGGRLTYRKGPYGGFWGCSNYRGNEDCSCTYTRKFK